jgi:hypothetical protein
MRALSRGVGYRLAAVGVGVVGGLVWILLAGDDHTLRDVSDSPGAQDRGRSLTPAERDASADCVSVRHWKHDHDGYPPPYLLVKPVGGGPAERLPFDEAWALAESGEVWTHRACAAPAPPRAGRGR